MDHPRGYRAFAKFLRAAGSSHALGWQSDSRSGQLGGQSDDHWRLIVSLTDGPAAIRIRGEIEPNGLYGQEFREFIAPLGDDDAALF